MDGVGSIARKSGSKTGNESGEAGGEMDCRLAIVWGSIAGVDSGDGLEERETRKGMHVLVT